MDIPKKVLAGLIIGLIVVEQLLVHPVTQSEYLIPAAKNPAGTLLAAALLMLLAKSKPPQLALVLLCAGFAGNVLHLLRFGHIIDYIPFAGFSLINLNDIFISAGIVWILIWALKNRSFDRSSRAK